jgi:hypothetical protein
VEIDVAADEPLQTPSRLSRAPVPSPHRQPCPSGHILEPECRAGERRLSRVARRRVVRRRAASLSCGVVPPVTSRGPKTENTAKQEVLAAVEKLPAGATFEDAIERLVFLAKIDRGLAEVDSGQGIDHGEAKRRLLP